MKLLEVFAYSAYLFPLIRGFFAQEPEARISVLRDFDANGDNKQENNVESQPDPKYTDDPDLWTDFSNFIDDIDISSVKLCITGVFLLYKYPNYGAMDETDVRLVNGIEKCIQVEDVSSVQMVSSFQSVQAPQLTVFKNEYFKGRGFPVARSVPRFDSSFGDNVKSLIISGPVPWTVVSSKGVTYCLKAGFDKATVPFPICMLTTINDTIIGKDSFWSSVKSGCKANSKMVEINSCLSFSEAESGAINDQDLQPGGDGEVRNETKVQLPAITECNKNTDFLTLLDLRLNNDFSSVFQIRFPKNKNNAWRTDIIDTVFDITMISCPMVDSNVQGMLNEMFIFLIEKFVWSKGAGWPKEHTDDPEIVSIVSQLEMCLAAVDFNDNILHVVDMVTEKLDFIDGIPMITVSERSEFMEGSLLSDFKRNVTLDFTLEMIWLMANQVVSTCHIASEGRTNFWVDFYPIFKEMYLTPMVKFWSNPGDFANLYPYLFGGMQLHLEYEAMALCSSYYSDMSHLGIYSRPSELTAKQ